MMRILGALAAILLAVAEPHAQDASVVKPAGPAPNDAALIANERALYSAVAKADRASFRSLALPGGVWTTKPGFVPMDLLADRLDSFTLSTWDIVNPRVTWLDENAAIVAYAFMATGTSQSQPVAPVILASTVWTRRNGKWLAAHHQETDLAR